MKYYFVLGTNTALSVAELEAAIAWENPRLLAPDFLLAEVREDFQAERLISRLGGTIKIGRVGAIIKSGDDRRLLGTIAEMAAQKQSRNPEGKFNFGFSDYGKRYFNKKDLGIKLKKIFQEEGLSSRFVVSREKTLSSVVVAQNRLLTRGIEITLAGDGDDILIGETLAVQPFKDLSLRDFGRPARDDRSGMLPPKLAQIMINLAGPLTDEAVIIDPFCGSGTVLTEALLLGYKNIFGSDISPEAIAATRKNISWVRELYKISTPEPRLFEKKAQQLSKFIKPESIDAVITEPYLGPQRGRIDFAAIIKELEDLYSASIAEFFKILKPRGRVVMVWPLYYGERPISPDYSGFNMKNVIPDELRRSPFVRSSNRGTIVYGRSGQKVFREIVVLDKE